MRSAWLIPLASLVLLAGCDGSAAAVELGFQDFYDLESAYEEVLEPYVSETEASTYAEVTEDYKEMEAASDVDIDKLKDKEYVVKHCLDVQIGDDTYTLPIKAGNIKKPYALVTKSGSKVVDNVSRESYYIANGIGENLASCTVINPYEEPVPVEDLYVVGIELDQLGTSIAACGGISPYSSIDNIRTVLGDSFHRNGSYDFTEAYDLPAEYHVTSIFQSSVRKELPSPIVRMYDPDIIDLMASLSDTDVSRYLRPSDSDITGMEKYYNLSYFNDNIYDVRFGDTELRLPFKLSDIESLGYTIEWTSLLWNGKDLMVEVSCCEYESEMYVVGITLHESSDPSISIYGDINSNTLKTFPPADVRTRVWFFNVDFSVGSNGADVSVDSNIYPYLNSIAWNKGDS